MITSCFRRVEEYLLIEVYKEDDIVLHELVPMSGLLNKSRSYIESMLNHFECKALKN